MTEALYVSLSYLRALDKDAAIDLAEAQVNRLFQKCLELAEENYRVQSDEADVNLYSKCIAAGALTPYSDSAPKR